MPLHLIVQCCKCKESLSHDIWSIARNHKYADSKYLCSHFSVTIDHESSCGFFGINWRNKIVISAYCKENYLTRTIINSTFNRSFMEHEDYAKFGNIVCHARISDSRGNYPYKGFNIQNEIENEYNERIERQKREEMERKRQEERDMQLQLDNMIERGREEELLRNNEIQIVKEETKKKKKFKSHIKLIELDIDKIFENMYDIKIEKA